SARQRRHGRLAGGAVDRHLAGEPEDLALYLGEALVVLAALPDGRYLRGARTNRPRDGDVLDPLVLGVAKAGDLQDRELAQDRIELELTEQCAGVLEPRIERALRVREHAKHRHRMAIQHLADRARSAFWVGVGQVCHGGSGAGNGALACYRPRGGGLRAATAPS